jgi:hypothetical protein
MGKVILSPIPLQVLRELLQQVVREEITRNQNEDLQEKMLTPKETCKPFSPTIKRQALCNWTKKILIRHDNGVEGTTSTAKYNKL